MGAKWQKWRAISLKYFPLTVSVLAFASQLVSEVALFTDHYRVHDVLGHTEDIVGYLFFPNSLWLFVYGLYGGTLAKFFVWMLGTFFVVVVPLSLAIGFAMEWIARRCFAILVLIGYFALSIAADRLVVHIAFSM